MSEVTGSAEPTPESSRAGMRWTWVAIGVGLGAILLATLIPIVESALPRPDVAILVGALTLVLTGVLVGYHSPGRTVAEAAVAGVILAGLILVVVRVAFDFRASTAVLAGGLILALSLSTLGGWVGEVLQGTVKARGPAAGFQWPWIVVGTVLGVMMNCYAVFVLHALLDLSSLGVLIAFLTSFLVAGFFVGYFSPGVTILEPALAALLMVACDMFLSVLGFRAPFPMLAVALGMVAGFLLALVGGYVGEVASNLRHKKAWGDEQPGTYRPVAKPGV